MDFCRLVVWGNNGGFIGDLVEMVEVGLLIVKLFVIFFEDGVDKSGMGLLFYIVLWFFLGVIFELIVVFFLDNDGFGSVCVIVVLCVDNMGVFGNGLLVVRFVVDFEEVFGEFGRSIVEVDVGLFFYIVLGFGLVFIFGLIGFVDNVGSDSVVVLDFVFYVFFIKLGNFNVFFFVGFFVLFVFLNVVLFGLVGVGGVFYGLFGSIVVFGFVGGLVGVDYVGIVYGFFMIWL